MGFLSTLDAINKIFVRNDVCENVSDSSVQFESQKAALTYGFSGFYKYTDACDSLDIKMSYLNKLIRENKQELGEFYHHPRTGSIKWIHETQLAILRKSLNNKRKRKNK